MVRRAHACCSVSASTQRSGWRSKCVNQSFNQNSSFLFPLLPFYYSASLPSSARSHSFSREREMELKVLLISFACSPSVRRVTSATLPIPCSSSSPHPPPAPVPPLSSDWNLETHLLPHHSSQLQPCQVVCTRLPSLSSLPFSPLTALSFLSLSSCRLLQALWRICPNYLSYWQLCVNKTKKKCVAFSQCPLHFLSSFSIWTLMLSHLTLDHHADHF